MASSQPLGLPPIDQGQPAADPATLAPLPPLQAVGAGLSLPPAVAGNLPPVTPAPLGYDGEPGDQAFLDHALAARQAAVPGQVASTMQEAASPVAAPPTGGLIPQVITMAPGGAAPMAADRTAPNPEELAQKADAEGRALAGLAADQEKALRKESVAIDAASALQQKQDAEAFALARKRQEDQDALDARFAEKQSFYQGERQKATEAVGKAVDEANKTPFDENHYMHSMGVGSTALTLLSVALGGMGAAFTGGPNVGVQMMNAAIERDIDAQKYAYQKKRQTVADKQTAYAQLREQGMDDQQAYQGATLVRTAQLNTALNTLAAKYAAPKTEANRQMLQAALAKTAVSAQAGLLQATMSASAQNWNQRMQLAQIDALSRNRPPDAADIRAKEMAQLTITGLDGHAKTPEAYNKASEVESSYRTIIPEVRQLIRYREKNGREKLNRTDLAKAGALAHDVQLQAKNLYQLGVLSESDLKMLSTLVPEDVNSFFSFDDSVVGQLGQFSDSMTLSRNSKLGVWGFREPASGSVLGPVAGERPVAPQ